MHNVKQRLLRNRPGSDTVTSRNFLRKRLQRHSLMQTSFTELPNRVTNYGSDWRKAVERATVNFRDIQYQIFSIGGYIPAQLQSSQSSVPLLQNFGYVQFEICLYMPSSDILCSQRVLAVLIFLSSPPTHPPPLLVRSNCCRFLQHPLPWCLLYSVCLGLLFLWVCTFSFDLAGWVSTGS